MEFRSERLHAKQVKPEISELEREQLLLSIVSLLSPKVVENLPPYFHNILSMEDAATWLDRMLSESSLFMLEDKGSTCTLGLLFVSNSHAGRNHIGYLLAPQYWGQGLASELLAAFLVFAQGKLDWNTLVAGVDVTNVASLKLLRKLGFSQSIDGSGDVVFFEYDVNSR
ncbi:N-acetyltransferase [Alginatibacterium sediminis]|uniref:N-acetyltransferase n=1 Tax=Alginatibacterium sediminis TaxID=2164068 RepID=A0A420EDG0_9ALTE|nr:GNAT family N-acetyltransferase [Alginatibacterium sediminis]RKF18737.1 N-acetyltransferase [Alginatibacterium sediminis]